MSICTIQFVFAIFCIFFLINRLLQSEFDLVLIWSRAFSPKSPFTEISKLGRFFDEMVKNSGYKPRIFRGIYSEKFDEISPNSMNGSPNGLPFHRRLPLPQLIRLHIIRSRYPEFLGVFTPNFSGFIWSPLPQLIGRRSHS